MLFQPRSTIEKGAAGRHLLFLGVCAISLILFHKPLEKLASLAIGDDRYTPNLAIPFIGIGLVWLSRRNIFRNPQYSPAAGLALMGGGLALFFLAASSSHREAAYILSASVLAAVVVWTGAFVCCYGTQTARSAMFPLLFLLLMIPIPPWFVDHVVVALQRGSAEAAYRLFRLAGIPVLRESAVRFALPGVTIEVAQECSGIRSSLSLFICSVAAGYLFLRSSWARASLALASLPIVIFKNAVRIVTISSLGVYVDPGFLHGRLHRNGGLPFSVLALALLVPVLLLLIRTEGRETSASESSSLSNRPITTQPLPTPEAR